ncbi:MAG: hypothetical protein QM760_02135 [Nibricoccus sp.]
MIACSALKAAYRQILQPDPAEPIRLVYLRGSPELLAGRLAARSGHFMKPSMLASQLATLEEPAGALVADIALSPKISPLSSATRCCSDSIVFPY